MQRFAYARWIIAARYQTSFLYCAARLSSAPCSRRTHRVARLRCPSPSPGLATLTRGRGAISNNEAAHVFNRQPRTLQKWACLEKGPSRPVRINGRLAWKVFDLASLLEQP